MFNSENNRRLRSIEWNLVGLRQDLEQMSKQLEKIAETMEHQQEGRRITIYLNRPEK